MGIIEIHKGLANTAVLFVAALGIWALVLRFRSRPLDNSWKGAAMIGELVIVAEAALGGLLYLHLCHGGQRQLGVL